MRKVITRVLRIMRYFEVLQEAFVHMTSRHSSKVDNYHSIEKERFFSARVFSGNPGIDKKDRSGEQLVRSMAYGTDGELEYDIPSQPFVPWM